MEHILLYPYDTCWYFCEWLRILGYNTKLVLLPKVPILSMSFPGRTDDTIDRLQSSHCKLRRQHKMLCSSSGFRGTDNSRDRTGSRKANRTLSAAAGSLTSVNTSTYPGSSVPQYSIIKKEECMTGMAMN